MNSSKFNAGLLNYLSITNVAKEIRETLSNTIKLTQAFFHGNAVQQDGVLDYTFFNRNSPAKG